jgi:hypothetical protein
MTRRLTYIGQTPGEGTGSPVIVLRHLRRLAEHGWRINIIAEHGQDTSACERAGWSVQHLPLRRSWWPPFNAKSRFSRTVRTYLLARECRQLAGSEPPDAIFGYLAAHADFSPEIAAHFARQTNRPFTLLVHDDAAAFEQNAAEKRLLRRRHAWIIRQTHRCWFVSPELAEEYDVPVALRRVLLPIPEGWPTPSTFKPQFAGTPKVYYAGFIWPPQYPLLTQIARALQQAGARLVLLSKPTPELKAFVANEPADWVAPFVSNREALEHLVENAAGLMVSYAATIDEMPWVATSYPSKFVEYSHLGIPAAIVAPRASAIGRWAEREQFPFFFAPEKIDELRAWAGRLREPAEWQKLAGSAHSLARGPFSAELIHAQLESELLRGADTR